MFGGTICNMKISSKYEDSGYGERLEKVVYAPSPPSNLKPPFAAAGGNILLYRSFLLSNWNSVPTNQTHLPSFVFVIVATHTTRFSLSLFLIIEQRQRFPSDPDQEKAKERGFTRDSKQNRVLRVPNLRVSSLLSGDIAGTNDPLLSCTILLPHWRASDPVLVGG
ncbi:hypothetical protein E2542_SST06764 [Spatholobus suberectus]|nr:hypothetical protein E2542_SST06764 [Spatholobus suberectus]